MTAYRADDRTFRGSPEDIARLREQLTHSPSESLDDELRASGADLSNPDTAQILAAAHESLAAPIIRIELTVAGPGALQRHEIAIGVNGVGVRQSPVRDDLSELSVFPFVQLPGGLARLMRFFPGRDTPPGLAPLRISADEMVRLASPEAEERIAAFRGVSALIEKAGLADPENSSWQIVQIACGWHTPAGEDAERIALHLRSGDQYFLLAEDGAGFVLDPVTSIQAWEHTIQALPGNHEVAPPA